MSFGVNYSYRQLVSDKILDNSSLRQAYSRTSFNAVYD